MIRRTCVAGQFYPGRAESLKKQLSSFIDKNIGKEDVIGMVAPHAGYMYSGAVAGACYSRINAPATAVIIGPNHTGMGKPFSIMTDGVWQMPMGDVQIERELAQEILGYSRYLEKDTRAHESEHSIEVQVPFLQYLLPEVKIVPIVLAGADFEIYEEIACAIAKAIKNNGPALIIASSDMTHYAPEEKAKRLDTLAIESILKLDGKSLLARVQEHNITMCGYGPVACMLTAAKALKARSARLIRYQTSGDTGGDYSSVVGYAGILVS